MNKKLRMAILVSALIHAAVLTVVALWYFQCATLLGGGSGAVEVAVVGDGSNSVSLRAQRSNLMDFRGIATAPSEPRNDEAGSATNGSGEGGGAGSGDGVGSGSGSGDPRLVAIWKKINRSKYYPEMARRQGVEGSPKVVFSISEDGRVGGVKVVESSGNEILDNAAIEAIQNSAPLPFYPQPITIAVRYSLKDR